MTATATATILVQADTPAAVEDLAAELATLGATARVVGAYDVLLTVNATGSDALGRIVLAVQEVDGVARTLTLPHVTEEPSR